MSRRTVGVGLIGIAALVYSARVIATAIVTAKFSNFDPQIFANYLGYTDAGISVLTTIAILAGIGYLAWAEVADHKKSNIPDSTR